MDTLDMHATPNSLAGAPRGRPSRDEDTGATKTGPIRFVVPGQPQGKGRPRVGNIGGHARMFTPAKTLAYEGFIALRAQIAMQHRDLVEGPVLVRMFIALQVPESKSQKWKRQALAGEVFPTTKPDVDNTVKAVFDALNGVVWKDDVQVVDLQLAKRYSATPRVEVEIVPIAVAVPSIKPASLEQLELT